MKSCRSAKFELADVLLTDLGGLDAFVRDRRMRFRPVGWEAIAAEVVAVTGGRVRITGVSLRKWFAQDDTPAGSNDQTSVVSS